MHKGVSNEWNPESKKKKSQIGQTDNLKKGTPAAKESPKSGHFETNINSKDWHIVSPEGKHYCFRNLNLWAENNYTLFGFDDITDARKVSKGIGMAKRATEGKNANSCTYKGWSVVVEERKKNKRIDYSKFSNYDLSALDELQRCILTDKISGFSNSELEKKYNKSRQKIYSILYSAKKKLENPSVSSDRGRKKAYIQFKDCDMSLLSDYQKIILEERISGLSVKEIAQKYNSTSRRISSVLQIATAKLEKGDGYVKYKREAVNKYNKGNPDKARETRKRTREKYREKYLLINKENSKRYYQENRKKKLEYARKRRLQQKLTMLLKYKFLIDYNKSLDHNNLGEP